MLLSKNIFFLQKNSNLGLFGRRKQHIFSRWTKLWTFAGGFNLSKPVGLNRTGLFMPTLVCHLEYLKESIYEGLRSGGTCYHGGILCFSKYLQCLKPSLQSLVNFSINMCNCYDNNIL